MRGSLTYGPLWHAITEAYRALGPEGSSFRAPGPNHLQLGAGGKAAHYEWKVLHGPRPHIEVALHFEGPTSAENDHALAQVLLGGDAPLRAGTLTPFKSGRWGGKWTRAGFEVGFTDVPGDETIQRSAELMKLLVERTSLRIADLLEASAKTGWPAA